MQNWLGIGLVVAASVIAVPIVDGYVKQRPQGEPATQSETARDTPRESVSSRRITLQADHNGHFHVNAKIGARTIEMMADTGASIIALTYDDARRIGLRPSSLDFSGMVSTANGRARVAPVMLDRVSVKGITVYDVQAAVLQDGALETSLLGMSFIGQLDRFDLSGDRLTLAN